MKIYFLGILEAERKEKKQQADESAKQIKLLQGKVASSEAMLLTDWNDIKVH